MSDNPNHLFSLHYALLLTTWHQQPQFITLAQQEKISQIILGLHHQDQRWTITHVKVEPTLVRIDLATLPSVMPANFVKTIKNVSARLWLQQIVNHPLHLWSCHYALVTIGCHNVNHLAQQLTKYEN